MMTREEAIKVLNNFPIDFRNSGGFEAMEALKIAILALRPVSREQVEKVWRGCPDCKPRCGLCVHMGAWDRYGKPCVCEQCVECSNFESDQKFCECCGAPMTDEAVEMVMERLEALKDG